MGDGTSVGDLEATIRLVDLLSPALDKVAKNVQGAEGKMGDSFQSLMHKLEGLFEGPLKSLGLFNNVLGETAEKSVGFSGKIAGAWDAMKESLEKGGMSAEEAGSALAVMAGGAVAAVAAIALVAVAAEKFAEAIKEGAVEAVEFAHHIGNLSERTGLSTTALQQMSLAAAASGVGLDRAAMAFNRFQRSMENTPQKLQKLGISLQELKSQTPDKQMEMLGTAIMKIEDPAKRTAMAMDLLGRAGAMMIPMFETMAKLKEMGGGDTLGMVMPEGMINSLHETSVQGAILSEVWNHLWMNMGAGIASSEAVQQILEALTQGIGALSQMALEAAPVVAELLTAFAGPFIDELKLAADGFQGLREQFEKLGGEKEVLEFTKGFISGVSQMTVWVGRLALALSTAGLSEFARAAASISSAMSSGPMPDVKTPVVKLDYSVPDLTPQFEALMKGAEDATKAEDDLAKKNAEVAASMNIIAAKMSGDPFAVLQAEYQKSALAANQYAQGLSSTLPPSEVAAARSQQLSLAYQELQMKQQELLKSLLGPGLQDSQAQMDALGKAVQMAGGESGLTAEQMEHVADTTNKLAAAGAQADPGLQKIADDMAKIASEDHAAEAVQNLSDSIQEYKLGFLGMDDNAIQLENQAMGFNDIADKSQVSTTTLMSWISTMEKAKEAGTNNAAVNKAFTASMEELDHRLSSMNGATLAQTIKSLQDMEHNGTATAASMKTLDDAIAEMRSRGTDFRPILDAMEEMQKKAEQICKNLEAISNIVGGIGDLGDLFGMQNVADGAKAAADWTQKWDDAISSGKLDITKIPGLIKGIIDGFNKATDSASAMARALGGAEFGAQIGSQIGAAFGPTGTVIGAIAGGLIGGIAGIFHKPAWMQIGKDAGRVLGMNVSEELAKTIQKTMKDLHVDVSTASLLNLDRAMAESGKAATTFMPQIMQLFGLVSKGGDVAAKSVEQLGKAFTALQKEADAGSSAAARGMVQMIQAARASGTVIPEIAAAVKAGLDAATSGVEQMTKNFHMASPADAEAEGYIFAATFWAKVSEEGIVKAAESMLPAWTAYQEALKTAGIDPAVVTAITGPLTAVFDALADEGTKKLIDGLDGATQAVKGLADAGYMTQGSFQGLEQVASSTYDQLIAGGMDSATALMMIAPSLAEIQKLHEQYGVTIDDTTQKLMDQAQAAGVAFPTDPLQQVIDLLKQIAIALGALPKQTNLNVTTHYSTTGKPPGTGGSGGGGEEGEGPANTGHGGGEGPGGPEKFAVGGTVYRPTLAIVGDGGPEDMVPHSKRVQYAQNVLAAQPQPQGDTFVLPIYIGGQKIDEVIMRRIKGGFIRVN